MSTPWGSRLTWVVAGGVLLALCVVGWLVWATDGDFTSEEVDVAAEQVVGGPEDCWGGALDGEPMACYVLEHAQADGALKVVGVFQAPSGPLYVMLARSDPVDEVLLGLLRAWYRDFLVSAQGAELYGFDSGCGDFETRASCVDAWVGDGPWYITPDRPFSMFSAVTSTHDDVLLLPGGLAGREHVSGWASWQQLWPAGSISEQKPASQSSGEGADASIGPFDVSDVDMVTGLADEDCESHDLPVSDGMCLTWRTYGHLGLVGVRGTRDYFPGEIPTDYIQIKSPPSDPQEVERMKLELLDDYDKTRYRAGEFNMEFVPVKYDLGEMWRWAVVLDRFKYSKGNTIGFTGAWIGTNGAALNDPENIRTVINVKGLDPTLIAQALPELLPALGIPLDAIGRLQHDETDQRRWLDVSPAEDADVVEHPSDINLLTDDGLASDDSGGGDTGPAVEWSNASPQGGPAAENGTTYGTSATQGGQDAVSGTSSEGGGVASGGSDADPQGMAALRGSGGPVEGSEAQSLAASSEVAESGSSGSAESGGGVSVWWLMGLAAMAAIAAIGVGMRRARRT